MIKVFGTGERWGKNPKKSSIPLTWLIETREFLGARNFLLLYRLLWLQPDRPDSGFCYYHWRSGRPYLGSNRNYSCIEEDFTLCTARVLRQGQSRYSSAETNPPGCCACHHMHLGSICIIGHPPFSRGY